jgi:predicted DNA-binding transcriptional regulator AlpA
MTTSKQQKETWVDAPALYTIPEFIRAHRISRGTFYNLIRRGGEGPRLTKIGRRRFVSREEAERWVKRHTGSET